MPYFLRKIISFLSIGLVGLSVDMFSYSLIFNFCKHDAISRFASLCMATPVTWALNRWLTFSASGRSKHLEAIRYGIVTGVAQSFNLFFFMFLRWMQPEIAAQWLIVTSALTAAALSFSGHFLFSFAPLGRKA
jgi:putative flippase GtrA